MKKSIFPKYYGLKNHFVVRALLSLLLCLILFVVLYTLLVFSLENFSLNPDFIQSRVSVQTKSLQKYVDDNSISSTDIRKIKKWENRQPVNLLEIYKDNVCIYGSLYSPTGIDKYSDNYFILQLTDGPVLVNLLSDFTYQFFLMGIGFSAIISLALFIILIIIGNRNLIQYVCRLNGEVQILEGGNLDYEVSVQGNDEITDLARSMNRMRTSIQVLQESRNRLVTDMSHDLRTPLTGLMLYLEIIKAHRYSSEEELQNYLLKIEGKARHLKMISDNLLEYATKYSVPKAKEPVPVENALRKNIESLVNDLENNGFTVSNDIEWTKSFVVVNNDYVIRILENIFSNITKYAQPATVIHIDSMLSDLYFAISFVNTCSGSTPEVESHGIGIDSIRNMMEMMGGRCSTERTDELFEITLLFPVK